MHHVIILPGNGAHNREWGEAASAAYRQRFDSCFVTAYDHWESGAPTINFRTELKKIAAHIAELPRGIRITIIAKSAGSILALLALEQGICTPVQCVYFGMPLDWAGPAVFKNDWSILSAVTVPTIAFHNDEDPTAKYEVTKNMLHEYGSKNVLFVPIVGTTHDYLDFPLYQSNLDTFLQL